MNDDANSFTYSSITKVKGIVLHESRVTCEVIKRFDQNVRLKLIAVSIKVTREGRCDVTCVKWEGNPIS